MWVAAASSHLILCIACDRTLKQIGVDIHNMTSALLHQQFATP